MTHNGVTGYVRANDAGLQSEPRAVGRRIGKMLDALASLNGWICQEGDTAAGERTIAGDCWNFRQSVMAALEADGWIVKINSRDNYSVTPGKAYWASFRQEAK